MRNIVVFLSLFATTASAFNSAFCPVTHFTAGISTKNKLQSIPVLRTRKFPLMSASQSSTPLERRSFLSLSFFFMLCKDSVLHREAANAAETPSASFLQRISLTAKDLEEEVEFFTSGLGFRLRQVRNLLAITLPRYRKLLCASALAPAR
jgi:hypothetical protein